jgi:Raf kinase inhibitor-like YbhB/YbcL family protein
MSLSLVSPAFQDGQTIPRHFTDDGMDVSPPLTWTEPPHGTQSFALICDDPDAPRGDWAHWVLYDLPRVKRELPEALPADPDLDDGSHHGSNDFGYVGYGGPAPARGKAHRYLFHLYALDTELNLPSGVKKRDVLDAMHGHILEEARLIGMYSR